MEVVSSRNGTGFMTTPTTMTWAIQTKVKITLDRFSGDPPSIRILEGEEQAGLLQAQVTHHLVEINFT